MMKMKTRAGCGRRNKKIWHKFNFRYCRDVQALLSREQLEPRVFSSGETQIWKSSLQ